MVLSILATKRGVVAMILALGLTASAVAASLTKQSAPQAADKNTDQKASPASTANASKTPHITVNGKPLDLKDKDSAEVNLPGSKTTVKVEDGQTTVTTRDSNTGSTSTSQVQNNENVDVHVHSDSVNGGHTSTQVFSSQIHGGSSTKSSSSTHVFSSGSAHVDVSN